MGKAGNRNEHNWHTRGCALMFLLPLFAVLIWLMIVSTTQAAFIPTTAHDALVASATGYFAHAGGTGGQGGEVVYVTHLGDIGAGSLRSYLESPDTLIILFEDNLNGTISLTDEIEVEYIPASQ